MPIRLLVQRISKRFAARACRLPRLACFLLLGGLVSGVAQAGCASQDPAKLAKAFYTRHADFYYRNPAKIKSLVTARFLSLMQREYRCIQGDLCAIESDPWSDAQDGEISQPLIFETVNNTGLQASVAMRYTFVLSRQRQWQQSLTFKFERASAQGCWLLADLERPKNGSLLNAVEAWHKQYGEPH